MVAADARTAITFALSPRYQPASELAQWFRHRTEGTGPNRRARRIAIVAVARRLVILLWRYLKDGVIPQGVQMKSSA